MRREVRSYRDLPKNLYQIQVKFRDEVRPRFGLMRGREFIMKDAYSFHVDVEDARREYRNMFDTYGRIFARCGLSFRPVEAGTGPSAARCRTSSRCWPPRARMRSCPAIAATTRRTSRRRRCARCTAAHWRLPAGALERVATLGGSAPSRR